MGKLTLLLTMTLGIIVSSWCLADEQPAGGQGLLPCNPGSASERSRYDLAKAKLTIKKTKGEFRYEVKIPGKAKLSQGTFLVRLIFGRDSKATFSPTIYATYGKNARLGGEVPVPLKGTGALVYVEENKKVKGAKALVARHALVVVVPNRFVAGRKLIYAEVYGGSDVPKARKNEGCPWNFAPMKVLVEHMPKGQSYIGPIPVIPAAK